MKLKLFLLLLLAAMGGTAQTGRHFDADKMMSSSFTTQVYVDRDGFIWAATRNGLNRYDGYKCDIFKKEQNSQLGMASNYVNCLMQDHQGLFYVGMWGALQTYDGQRFQDVKTHDLQGNVLPCYISCLLQRKSGEIVVGTSGHGLMHMAGKNNAYQKGGPLQHLKTVLSMIEDSRSRLWLITADQGLWCCEGADVRHYLDGEEQRNSLVSVCEDREGHIYVGTRDHGLLRMEGRQFVHIEATGHRHVSALYVNRQGHILIGYDGNGLAIYHPQSGELQENPYYSREVDLTQTKVYSITEDQRGNCWLGLLQKGVYMQPTSETGFNYMGPKLGTRNMIGTASVISVLKSKDGRLWIGTDCDGLYCLTPQGKTVKHFRDHFPATILALTEDLQGRIWTGSYKEGLGWIDPHSLTYHHYPLPQGPAVSVFDLEAHTTDNAKEKTAETQLWIATMGQGLLRLNPATNDVKAYVMADGAANNRHVNSIVNNYIPQLALSPDGQRIYVATTMGVCAMHIDTEDWLKTFNGTNCPNYGVPVRIAREFAGKLRIGTNDGLFCYDLTKHAMHQHGMESGLAAGGICSIEQDRQGCLWVSTDHGLCCVDPKTQQVSSYFVDNGLQSNEFSNGASWAGLSVPSEQTREGNKSREMLVFGGVGGITWFAPEDIVKSQWQAEVKLVGMSVNGTNVTPGTMSGLWQVTDTAVIASKRFVLSHSDNTFALQLSTLTYDSPEHIVYRYRINNEQWVRLQPGVNEITFSHIAPGNYHFCVVADRNDKSTPERCFEVVIHAPWYATPLAYLIYLLVAAAAVWYYLHLQRRKEQDRLRLQQHIHAEEMADAKLKFFMNMSHEIRTPMTLIVTPLLSLMRQDDDPHRHSIYETMRRNAERILGVINQMMDLRKIDKGQMHMHMAQTELIAFIDDIHNLFAQQAKAKNMTFLYTHNTNQLPVWIDRSQFDKVIVNILSNAFKFTPTGGQIVINVTHNEQHATIAVKDSGEGIPEEQIDKIFQRFYQLPTHNAKRNAGTGIGLDLTRALVELHHGTITAHNNTDGPGCEFVVNIPMGNAHLKPEEIDAEAPQQPSDTYSLLHDENAIQTNDDHETQPAAWPSTKKQHILVVEDDAEIRDYLKTELSDLYEVTTCDNGKAALAHIHRHLTQLVISDVMMPEMDGHTLCAKIKGNTATAHIPVVLLTAKHRDEDMLQGLETGADDYIVKPFNMDILRRNVQNLLQSRQQLQLKYARNDQLEQKVDNIELQSPDDKLMQRVMKAINSNLNNSDLSVDLIAQEVGISRVHLHRKMKELTGQTPHDFIRNLRLKQAAKLLAAGNMNVTEVVYACGFSNVPSFSTTFKKVYGMTPREYMNERK